MVLFLCFYLQTESSSHENFHDLVGCMIHWAEPLCLVFLLACDSQNNNRMPWIWSIIKWQPLPRETWALLSLMVVEILETVHCDWCGSLSMYNQRKLWTVKTPSATGILLSFRGLFENRSWTHKGFRTHFLTCSLSYKYAEYVSHVSPLPLSFCISLCLSVSVCVCVYMHVCMYMHLQSSMLFCIVITFSLLNSEEVFIRLLINKAALQLYLSF